MTFIEMVQVTPPGKPSPTIVVPSEKISFAFKKTFEPHCTVGIGDIFAPCSFDFARVSKVLVEDEGFISFDVPDGGGKCVVNPDRINFYMPMEIGIFSLMFNGRSAITVRATTEQIQKSINHEPLIDIS